MGKNRFLRVCFALWLGLVALAANGFEQRELSLNVIAATVSAPEGGAAFHVMPDGTIMAGSMVHGEAGGHTHKGHADCDVCGAVAEMAAITLPVLPVVPLPQVEFEAARPATPAFAFRTSVSPPYSSRAPPVLMS